MKKREVLTPLALPEELEITEVEMNDEIFTITAHCTRKYPCCPLCGTPAQRFHSHYFRRITDLPSGGMRVCLQVLVRKCFCDVNTCVRTIFAERLAPLRNRWHESRLVCFRWFKLSALQLVACLERVSPSE